MTTTLSEFAEHLADANAKLKLLRGSAWTPQRVLCDLRAAKCNARVENGILLISPPIPEELIARIREFKNGIIAVLTTSTTVVEVSSEPWCQGDASILVAVLLKLKEAHGYPFDPKRLKLFRGLQDNLDDAFTDRNMTVFLNVVQKLLTYFNDEYPKKIGKQIHFQPSPAPGYTQKYNGWIRTGGKKRWFAIMKGCDEKESLEEQLSEYATESNIVDRIVLPEGEDPNKKNWK